MLSFEPTSRNPGTRSLCAPMGLRFAAEDGMDVAFIFDMTCDHGCGDYNVGGLHLPAATSDLSNASVAAAADSGVEPLA